MRITVFTPTYNRAHTLPDLYLSLKKQTYDDFEWLIIDDGSTDNTQQLVQTWIQAQNHFPIRYYKQPNGGKHRAINKGVKLCDSELFFIVDSDDRLTNDALSEVVSQVDSIPSKDTIKYVGVCGCRGYSPEQLIGTTFLGETLDCTCLERSRYGISGDKAEVFYTQILKSYPFPEYVGENFITECVVWDKIAADGYSFRYFNKIIYLCEYLEDGLTHQGLELYYRNPNGYGHYLRMCRNNHKFSHGLLQYYDAECYYHWKEQMSSREIAQLLGTNTTYLLFISYALRVRRTLSKLKSKMKSILRGK